MTEVIEWSPTWQIGVAHIDVQHRRLVGLLADLQRQLNDSGPRVSRLDALVTLVAYIDLHFGDEESLMRQINYPQLEEHRAEHQRFVARVKQFTEAFRLGNTDLGEEMSQFLARWIVEHIARSDVKIAAFIKAEGVELTASMSFPALKQVDS